MEDFRKSLIRISSLFAQQPLKIVNTIIGEEEFTETPRVSPEFSAMACKKVINFVPLIAFRNKIKNKSSGPSNIVRGETSGLAKLPIPLAISFRQNSVLLKFVWR